MFDLQIKLQDLEYTIVETKKELRRIKTTINKVEKLGLSFPSELLEKKEYLEGYLKQNKQELKALKKVAELLK